jgi:hypothetical protein
MAYISKNFYSPKNYESMKPSHNYNSMSNINSSMHYSNQNTNYSSQNYSYLSQTSTLNHGNSKL